MTLQIATPLGQRDMTSEEEAVFIAEQQQDHTPQMRAKVLNEARALRIVIFARLDGIQASNLTKRDVALGNADAADVALNPVAAAAYRSEADIYRALAQGIEVAKQAMRDLTVTVDFTGCTTADQMRVKVLLSYKAITAVAPAEVKAAFAGLDQ